MGEHYTKNTVEVSGWCLKCGKNTMHRVDHDTQQGRLGPCLRCIEALTQVAMPFVSKEPEQLMLLKEQLNDGE